MYAKVFASIFEGSLRGKSDELLVFVNMLTHASGDMCDRHFRAIADETGISVERVRAAVVTLESPDLESRTPDEEGRRIVRLDPHRDWGWRIVNFEKYRKLRSEEDRREYQRNLMRERREKERQGNGASKPLASVSSGEHGLAMLAKAEAEAEAEADTCAEGREEELPGIDQPAAVGKRARHRDELLDLLVSLDGSNPIGASSSAFGRAAKALSIIREASARVNVAVTAEELGRRASNLRKHHPNSTCSSSALATHWAKCDAPPNQVSTKSKRFTQNI